MEFDVDSLYLPLDEAVRQLHARRKDEKLKEFADSCFITDIPAPLMENRPWAILSRYIASPTIEFDFFYAASKEYNLDPLMLEFSADKFVAKNVEKYSLCRMSFLDMKKNNPALKEVRNIINFNTDEGKPLNTIITTTGESLVDFHHRLLTQHLNGRDVRIHDFSEWFVPNRGNDRWTYYLKYLALFLGHGILFENFLTNERENEFTREVVIPAFRILTDITGMQPLIVRAIPKETENEAWWCYYEPDLKTYL